VRTVLCCLLLLTASGLNAKKRESQDDSLAKYLARVQIAQPPAPALSLGTIWVDSGRMASLSADYKAMTTGDLITVVVVQGVTSSNAGVVGTARTFNTSSDIDSSTVLGVGEPEPARVALVGYFVRQEPGIFRYQPDHHAGGPSGRRSARRQPGHRGRAHHQHEPREADHCAARHRAPGRYRANNTVASNTIGDLELEIRAKV